MAYILYPNGGKGCINWLQVSLLEKEWKLIILFVLLRLFMFYMHKSRILCENPFKYLR